MTLDVPELILSIIVPVRNGAQHLEYFLRQLDSLQALQRIEAVFIDDASEDSTVLQVQDAVKHRPWMLVLTNLQQAGASASRNRGFDVASGTYVWFVDIDDQWDPAVISQALDSARRTQVDILFMRAVRGPLSNSHQVLDGAVPAGRMQRAQVLNLIADGRIRGYMWSKLVRRGVLPPRPFPESMRTQEDFVALCTAIKRSSSFQAITGVGYGHVEVEGSLSSGSPDLGALERCAQEFSSLVEHFSDGSSCRATTRGLMAVFRLREINLAQATYSALLPIPAAGAVRRIATTVDLREVAYAMRLSRRVGARAAMLKAFPLLFIAATRRRAK